MMRNELFNIAKFLGGSASIAVPALFIAHRLKALYPTEAGQYYATALAISTLAVLLLMLRFLPAAQTNDDPRRKDSIQIKESILPYLYWIINTAILVFAAEIGSAWIANPSWQITVKMAVRIVGPIITWVIFVASQHITAGKLAHCIAASQDMTQDIKFVGWSIAFAIPTLLLAYFYRRFYPDQAMLTYGITLFINVLAIVLIFVRKSSELAAENVDQTS